MRASPACALPCLDVPCPLPRWTGPGALVGCFPRPCCLPRPPGGSASTTSLSRPAQASHTLRPIDSLDRPGRPLSQGSDPASCPAKPPASYRANRPLPGWDFHPQGERALRGAPEEDGGTTEDTEVATCRSAPSEKRRARDAPPVTSSKPASRKLSDPNPDAREPPTRKPGARKPGTASQPVLP